MIGSVQVNGSVPSLIVVLKNVLNVASCADVSGAKVPLYLAPAADPRLRSMVAPSSGLKLTLLRCGPPDQSSPGFCGNVLGHATMRHLSFLVGVIP